MKKKIQEKTMVEGKLIEGDFPLGRITTYINQSFFRSLLQ